MSMDISVDTKKCRWISRWIPNTVDGYLGGYQQMSKDISVDTNKFDGYLGGYLFLVSICLWNHMDIYFVG